MQEGYAADQRVAGPQYEIRAMIEDLIGVENTDAWYDAWLHNHIQKSDIDSLKAWGFNSVRLLCYNLWTLPIEDEPVAGENTWLDTGFELTDSLVAWARPTRCTSSWTCTQPRRPRLRAGDFGLQPGEAVPVGLDNKNKMVALWAHC